MEFQPSISKPIPPDQKILDILIEALKNEMERCALFLQWIDLTEDIKEKQILRQIRMNGHKHIRNFQDLFFRLTGEKIEVLEEDLNPLRMSIKADKIAEEHEKQMLVAIESSEFYRKIYFGFSDPEIRDVLFEAIMDEMHSALLLNYTFARHNIKKNRCKM